MSPRDGEIPVTAELRIEIDAVYEGKERTWRGSLASDDQRLKAAILNGVHTLRLPDGRAGRLRVEGGSYDMESPATSPVLVEVAGEGPAPFA